MRIVGEDTQKRVTQRRRQARRRQKPRLSPHETACCQAAFSQRAALQEKNAISTERGYAFAVLFPPLPFGSNRLFADGILMRAEPRQKGAAFQSI